MLSGQLYGVRPMRVGTVTNSVKVFETVNALFEAGKVSPLVQEVFPLE
jgi:hypothetical protein